MMPAPTLVKKDTGERIVAQTELAQLQEKREKLAAQLEELDDQILELKRKRHSELMEELHSLGLDDVKVSKPTSSASVGERRRKGRPRGFKMSEEQKKAMREGRQKARAAREVGADDPSRPT